MTGDTAPRILNLVSWQRWVLRHTHARFNSEKRARNIQWKGGWVGPRNWDLKRVLRIFQINFCSLQNWKASYFFWSQTYAVVLWRINSREVILGVLTAVRPTKLRRQRQSTVYSTDTIPLKPKLACIIFNNSVRTSKKAQLFTTTKINLTVLKKTNTVYSENHTKHKQKKYRLPDC
jgi:hypothetical protein